MGCAKDQATQDTKDLLRLEYQGLFLRSSDQGLEVFVEASYKTSIGVAAQDAVRIANASA